MSRRNGRLSDTDALVSKPFAEGETHSVSVRKIGNKFLTCTTRYNPATGECKTSEMVTNSAPRIVPARVDGRQTSSVGAEGLAETKRYLGKYV